MLADNLGRPGEPARASVMAVLSVGSRVSLVPIFQHETDVSTPDRPPKDFVLSSWYGALVSLPALSPTKSVRGRKRSSGPLWSPILQAAHKWLLYTISTLAPKVSWACVLDFPGISPES